jgi:hypothetical protein
MIGGSSPGRGWEFFSLHHRVQTGSGAHPTSYPVSTRGSFLEVKRPGREADHSSTSSAALKNAPSYRSAELKNAQGQLNFYVTFDVKRQEINEYTRANF